LPAANGQRYYGRGFVQITGQGNYRKAKTKTGHDLTSEPDLALDPAIAGEVLVRSMLEGWFGSGKPLTHYINEKNSHWVSARANVNPGSPNKLITAAYAEEMAGCLQVKAE
jgi:predicted chitinase